MPISQAVIAKINQYRKNLDKDFLEIAKSEDTSNSSLLLEILLRSFDEKIKYEIVTVLKAENTLLSADQLLSLDLNENLKIRCSSSNPKNIVVHAIINQQSIIIARVNVKELFTAAVDEWEFSWIDFLIDKKFISYQPSPIKLPEGFENGFWVRVFSRDAISKEIDNLDKRAALDPKLLSGHGEEYKENINSYGFDSTDYSPATFIPVGYKVSLFNYLHCAGVILLPRNNRVIDYWYSGLIGEELTRDQDYNNEILKGYQEKDGHHFTSITEKEISAAYSKCVKSGRALRNKKPDKYGVIEHSCQWPWNEGLFRYQIEDIYGIYVNPKSTTSIEAAFALRENLMQKLNLDINRLPYYFYDSAIGIVKRYCSDELQEKLTNQQSISVAAPSATYAKGLGKTNFLNTLPKPVASSSCVQESKPDSSQRPGIGY